MNVLHINCSDRSGGAAIAMNRLHHQLISDGINSHILAEYVLDNDNPSTHSVKDSILPYASFTDRLRYKYHKKYKYHYDNAVGAHSHWKALIKSELFLSCDVVNLHNLHSRYFNIRFLEDMSRVKPLVWLMHDMWPLTGHCAYSYQCDRWKKGCHDCPLLSEPGRHIVEPSPTPIDKTREYWTLKRDLYPKLNITIVAPSRWLVSLTKESILKIADSIHYVPNGININIFSPCDKYIARRKLETIINSNRSNNNHYSLYNKIKQYFISHTTSNGIFPRAITIPDNKIVIYASSFKSGRKGADLLLKALDILQNKDKYALMIAGGNIDIIKKVSYIMETINIGTLDNPDHSRLAYCASDLFVLPTLQDNQPLTNLESMACGIPVVSFDVGGVSELLHHNINGYLAQANNPEDLSKGISQISNDPLLRSEMGFKAHELVLSDYSLCEQSKRMKDIYENAINQFNRRTKLSYFFLGR